MTMGRKKFAILAIGVIFFEKNGLNDLMKP